MTPSAEWSAADDDDSDRATGHVPARNATESDERARVVFRDLGDIINAQIARIAGLDERDKEREALYFDAAHRADAAEVALAEVRETLAKVAALPVSLMLREMASGRKPGPVADKARSLAREFEDSLASAGRPSDADADVVVLPNGSTLVHHGVVNDSQRRAGLTTSDGEACEPDANFMFCTTHQTASGDWPCSVGSADRAAQIARIAELEAEVDRLRLMEAANLLYHASSALLAKVKEMNK